MVLGDSIVRDVGAGRSNMKVECFPGIRTDMVVIHVGANDVRFKNLDYIMGETHDLVNMAKTKFPNSRLVFSGMLRCRGVK